jgi:hypothetical protein
MANPTFVSFFGRLENQCHLPFSKAMGTSLLSIFERNKVSIEGVQKQLALSPSLFLREGFFKNESLVMGDYWQDGTGSKVTSV